MQLPFALFIFLCPLQRRWRGVVQSSSNTTTPKVVCSLFTHTHRYCTSPRPRHSFILYLFSGYTSFMAHVYSVKGRGIFRVKTATKELQGQGVDRGAYRKYDVR